MNEPWPRWKIIRSLLERYSEFKSYSETHAEGMNSFFIEWRGYTLSAMDLHNCLRDISPRKRQAVELYLIRGLTQTEASEIMQISPVTVGQYCKAACQKIARQYFAELPPEEEDY